MSIAITINPESPSVSPYQLTKPKAPDIVNDDFFTSFADLLDIINPLQHIPGVSTIYRELTGDGISKGAELVGSTLLGGPLGFISVIANEIIEQQTGNDLGSHVFASLSSPTPL